MGESNISAEQLRRNYLHFSLAFSVNHGVVTTPLILATSTLDEQVGYTGDALLYVFTLLSSFCGGAPMVGLLGPKGAALLAMLLLTFYVAFFAAATAVPHQVIWLQYALFCTGSCLGGIGAGILWTAQGSYFGRTADLLVTSGNAEREQLTAELSGQFAAIYLCFEVLTKLSWSGLDWLGLECSFVALIFSLVGVLSLLLMGQALWLSCDASLSKVQRVKIATSLWTDPAIFLIGGLNLTFGFSAALLNGFVNATYTAPQLGSFAVTLLSALTAFSAAALAPVLAQLSVRFGKGPVVFVGAACCFLGMPFSIFTLHCCQRWGWWLTSLYLLQGGGRSVYESTNRGVFLDFFPNDSAAAFANQQLQTSLALSLSFFLSGQLKETVLAWIVLVLSLLTPAGFLLACRLRKASAGCAVTRDVDSDASSLDGASERGGSSATLEGEGVTTEMC